MSTIINTLAITIGVTCLKSTMRIPETVFEICSKLTIKLPERPQCSRFGVFIANLNM